MLDLWFSVLVAFHSSLSGIVLFIQSWLKTLSIPCTRNLSVHNLKKKKTKQKIKQKTSKPRSAEDQLLIDVSVHAIVLSTWGEQSIN